MNLHLVSEIWKLLKPCIEVGDVDEAAEILINYLIEEDVSSNEIKTSFRGDSEIKKALKYYMETPEDSLYSERDEDSYDDMFYDEDSYDDYYDR